MSPPVKVTYCQVRSPPLALCDRRGWPRDFLGDTVHLCPMVDPVPAPRCAADHVKKTVQFVLEALLGREVILEKLDGPLLGSLRWLRTMELA